LHADWALASAFVGGRYGSQKIASMGTRLFMDIV
jgi:hypothetical protein